VRSLKKVYTTVLIKPTLRVARQQSINQVVLVAVVVVVIVLMRTAVGRRPCSSAGPLCGTARLNSSSKCGKLWKNEGHTIKGVAKGGGVYGFNPPEILKTNIFLSPDLLCSVFIVKLKLIQQRYSTDSPNQHGVTSFCCKCMNDQRMFLTLTLQRQHYVMFLFQYGYWQGLK
jgi:hypothetical protein